MPEVGGEVVVRPGSGKELGRLPPKGYVRGGRAPVLLSPQNDKKEGRLIPLTNKSFSEIDQLMNSALSETIDRLVNSKDHKDHIVIADLGGGQKSKAAQEIAKHYGNKVSVVGVDFVPNAPSDPSAGTIQGDITQLPLSNNSVNLAYSWEVLNHLDPVNDYEKGRKALEEIARILQPGGIALIDWRHFAHSPEGIEKSISSCTIEKRGDIHHPFLQITKTTR